MNAKEIYDALKKFDAEYIQFEVFQKAFAAIVNSLSLYRETGIAENIMIFGESGCGKTSLCHLIQKLYPRHILLERDVIPVLIVSLPTVVSKASLAERMLIVLGHPTPYQGSANRKMETFVALAKACGIEMILFDEASHLCDQGQAKTHYLVSDCIKDLSIALNIPLVLLGLPRAEKLLIVNEQLRRRFSKKIFLSLERHYTDDLSKQCLQMLLSLGQAFPVRIVAGEYGWDEFSRRLYYATDARVAYIKKLMANTLKFALELSITEVGPADFEVVYKQEEWWAESELNPFHPKFAFRRLDRAGEPFADAQGV
jgi:Bacterial TniB protein